MGRENVTTSPGMHSNHIIYCREGMEANKDGLVRISLEGNIGVGKSTILHLLQNDLRLQRVLEVLEEPVESWKKVNGTGLNKSNAYYENPERYADLFQSYVFITRILLHNSSARKSHPAVLLTERSVSTDRVVFVEALRDQGYLHELEAAAYDAWYNAVVDALPNVLADSFIYLRARPKVCYERLVTRAMSQETGVALDYLQLLHHKHDNWFLDGTSLVSSQDEQTGSNRGSSLRIIDRVSTPCGIQGRLVLVVDCNSNMNMAEKSPERDAIVDQIMSFILSRLSAKGRSSNCEEPVAVQFERTMINNRHQGNSQAPARKNREHTQCVHTPLA